MTLCKFLSILKDNIHVPLDRLITEQPPFWGDVDLHAHPYQRHNNTQHALARDDVVAPRPAQPYDNAGFKLSNYCAANGSSGINDVELGQVHHAGQ